MLSLTYFCTSVERCKLCSHHDAVPTHLSFMHFHCRHAGGERRLRYLACPSMQAEYVHRWPAPPGFWKDIRKKPVSRCTVVQQGNAPKNMHNIEYNPKIKASKRMRSSLVVRASDCQCTSCNGPGFDPSIRRHSEIWGAAGEAVLNTVWTVWNIPANLFSGTQIYFL